MAYDDIAADDRLAYNRAILAAYHAYLRDDRPDPVHVRAVYDAAARILNDEPAARIVSDDVDLNAPDVWRLRAAYIDAHAAWNQHPNHSAHTALRAARDALTAALAANEVT
jgi:hypothetical protein